MHKYFTFPGGKFVKYPYVQGTVLNFTKIIKHTYVFTNIIFVIIYLNFLNIQIFKKPFRNNTIKLL